MTLPSNLPPQLRRAVPVVAAVFVFALGFLAGRLSRRAGSIGQSSSLGQPVSRTNGPAGAAGHPAPVAAARVAAGAANPRS
ncbi:MAG TPA: hypothetical protein VJV74_04810, partial [Terriglobia bacterium]|nr:hypothetical protein [Terriglobia bacterium]